MLIKHRAFSLVEVLVFTTILSIFFIGAISVVTVSIRNMKFNENKIIALHYAKQLENWLRVEKRIDWGGNQCSGNCCNTTCNFTERITQDGSSTLFCFNQSPISDWPSASLLGCNDNYSLESRFLREVKFTSSLIGGFIAQVDVVITVSWLELGKVQKVTTNAVFSTLE
ncbi:hypothetical protein A3C98_00125 [Candidatus Roizmanbacteria bacterium RIFCSPHIGHO2_02_FULL_37_15]|uniref:Type II secretion system protein GspI C-terminal domain-containing protein n=1 Tax=Candidatus Roizmanbacteria bacterium RIFCSPLOWO2_01_FULL_37_16 TaxID=1802058 RepID=A0A1F7IKS9_9BACT|nr:MAG: hypothetical protein A2859_04690 [Candidatus Roizmanbacteria bacterium RIFCSPHIGHO2_01_FULL_37_16b]OGK22284.1 MAG: hypothetical protein A3C98_00125 [Candidatus Roizmanbacteria bacterium RIFCSPHIGHO2_02_FULL_37_15]OGK31797.1 MAG: hypothetical protein A3F57_00450 [Candidatus Roizmanbacteria bacterium RIFCSPHIGHO2_12_FULL_36_11]OGK43956.1 MAG: hypothetical protein A3B40_04085 [Candidatus Roizmanbacteria bacterium RIFCSPLOWO2_01_FULL_37_16]OGK56449.1 MAG: hypothetical protein A3I50_00410 [C